MADDSILLDLLAANSAYAASFTDGELSPAPARRVAVVACMDARVDVLAILGLQNGDAHVIRNAGGVISDDVIRSLCLSQRALGTQEIVLLHHTECGVQGVDEEVFAAELEADVGERPTWPLLSFDDPFTDVVHAIQRLRESPFVPNTVLVHGFVYDVHTGELLAVHPDD